MTYKTKIPDLIRAIHTGSVEGVKAVGAQIGQAADARVPVDTGALKDSRYELTSAGSNRKAVDDPDGRYTVTPSTPPANDLGVVIAYSAYYGMFVHEGHHTRSGSMVAGRPWMLEAFQWETGQAGNTFSRSLGQAIDALGGVD
jgi:hypothetical protein